MNRMTTKLPRPPRSAIALGLTNRTIPFQATISINTGTPSEEVVDLSGPILLLVHLLSPNPVLSPHPVHIYTNLEGVSGVGRTSGLQYQATGAEYFDLAVAVPGGFCFEGSYRLTLIDPGQGDEVKEVALPVKFFVALNAKGVVTKARAGGGG